MLFFPAVFHFYYTLKSITPFSSCCVCAYNCVCELDHLGLEVVTWLCFCDLWGLIDELDTCCEAQTELCRRFISNSQELCSNIWHHKAFYLIVWNNPVSITQAARLKLRYINTLILFDLICSDGRQFHYKIYFIFQKKSTNSPLKLFLLDSSNPLYSYIDTFTPLSLKGYSTIMDNLFQTSIWIGFWMGVIHGRATVKLSGWEDWPIIICSELVIWSPNWSWCLR